MRGLTLTQPWATLVAIGAKRIETRSWGTSYRGPIAIHAAKGLGSVGGKRGLGVLCGQPPFWEALGGEYHFDIAASLPLGAIVAVAELANVTTTERANCAMAVVALDLPEETERERAFGDYGPGRFAWVLDKVVQLDHPLVCRGALGLWTPESHVAAYCRGILDGAGPSQSGPS